MPADVDAHAETARAAGAEIIVEPKDDDYGGRVYSARDTEGYVWGFGNYDPWGGRYVPMVGETIDIRRCCRRNPRVVDSVKEVFHLSGVGGDVDEHPVRRARRARTGVQQVLYRARWRARGGAAQ